MQRIFFPGSKATALKLCPRSCVNQYEVTRCNFEDCGGSAIKVNTKGCDEYISPESVTHGRITENSIRGFNRLNGKWTNDGISVHDQVPRAVILASSY